MPEFRTDRCAGAKQDEAAKRREDPAECYEIRPDTHPRGLSYTSAKASKRRAGAASPTSSGSLSRKRTRRQTRRDSRLPPGLRKPAPTKTRTEWQTDQAARLRARGSRARAKPTASRCLIFRTRSSWHGSCIRQFQEVRRSVRRLSIFVGCFAFVTAGISAVAASATQPSQVVDARMREPVRLQRTKMEGNVISGEVVNHADCAVRDVNLLIQNAFADPSRVEYYTVNGEIPAGSSRHFSTTLPWPRPASVLRTIHDDRAEPNPGLICPFPFSALQASTAWRGVR
jgi:hypothetical protein